ncbi:hypothetical protein [Halarchaeum sp. P4]|uniref:hypothetical protein n=1 Tax=Halarchaeum sp. P4 TaxID=3421639 RepID=UPI003EB97182
MKPRADRIQLSREGKVPACPHCERATLSKRQTDDGTRWYCRQCLTHVDEADWRPRRSDGGPNSETLAARLMDADPDDFGGQA